MSLIKKSNEIKVVKNIKIMIYGQAGMGKSTLALSAPRPLLLDFDNGVKRVNTNHLGDQVGIVQVESWNDILYLLSSPNELNEFDSIVVDTIGKMMDYIIAYRCNGYQPRIQDWGAINNDFKWFTNALSGLNKNVIFVAHRDTRKEGEETVFIPALREKNYNSIVTELDLLGYLEMKNENGLQKRTITFDPTSRNDGKNTCQLPGIMNIPTILDRNCNVTAANDFIEKQIIAKYNAMIAVKEKKIAEYNEVLSQLKDNIALICDAQSANMFVKDNIKEYAKHGSSIVLQARDLFGKKVKELKLVYNKETKEYEDPEAA